MFTGVVPKAEMGMPVRPAWWDFVHENGMASLRCLRKYESRNFISSKKDAEELRACALLTLS